MKHKVLPWCHVPAKYSQFKVESAKHTQNILLQFDTKNDPQIHAQMVGQNNFVKTYFSGFLIPETCKSVEKNITMPSSIINRKNVKKGSNWE